MLSSAWLQDPQFPALAFSRADENGGQGCFHFSRSLF